MITKAMIKDLTITNLDEEDGITICLLVVTVFADLLTLPFQIVLYKPFKLYINYLINKVNNE